MKILFASSFILFISFKSFAVQQTFVEAGFIQWSETLTLQQDLSEDKDLANYNGVVLNFGQVKTYARWGWRAGALVGSGRAVGGGSNSLDYLATPAWSLYGLQADLFRRISGQVQLGVSIPLVKHQITWEKSATDVSVKAARNAMFGVGLLMTWRLTPAVELNQTIGTYGESAQGFWRTSLGYRF